MGGCAITENAEIKRDSTNEEKIMSIHFNDTNTFRIVDTVVLKGNFKPSPHGECVRSENRSKKSLYWIPPPFHVKNVYHSMRRNKLITRMYNLIYEHLLHDYIKKQHRAEVEAARKAREENKPIIYTGVVTKEMKEAAKVKDDKQIGHREVYDYLCDESNRCSKENSLSQLIQSENSKAAEKGPKSERKLDLGNLCHYLANVPIPGFEEPFEEPIIHLMFHQLENKREQGISLGDFKKLITDAAMDSQAKNSVDYLHGDDFFAYLLQEENSRHRGLVFDIY